MRTKLVPPYAGVADNTSFVATPAAFVPPDSLRNVRVFEPSKQRPRVGQRPGWRKLFDTLLGPTVQAVGVISRARSVTGLIPDTCSAVEDWSSTPAGPIAGQAWALDPDPALRGLFYIDLTGTGGGAADTANTIAVSPEGTHVAFTFNYTDSVTGELECRLVYATRDLQTVWTTTVSGAADGFAANSVAISNGIVWVAFATSTNQMLRGYARTTGAETVLSDLNGWARQAVSVKVWKPTAGEEYLLVAFTGGTNGATLPGGTVVTAGEFARSFRAGVMKIRIAANNSIAQVPFGAPRLDSSDTYYEANHQYARFSELTIGAPHGCEPTALAVSRTGMVALVHTNQGWGPNASFPPDGSGAPYTTVMLMDAHGRVQWEIDTQSLLVDDGSGRYNDMTTPTLKAAAFDEAGNLYVAGLRNHSDAALGACVFRIEPDGTIRWRKLVSSQIFEGAMAVDPTDGNVLVGGTRNATVWGGGVNAHLWKLNALNGAVLWGWDLGLATPVTGVAAADDGRIFYTTNSV